MHILLYASLEFFWSSGIHASFRSISLIATVLSPVLTNDQRRLLLRVCLVAALLSRLAMQNLVLVQPYLVKRLKELRRLACNAFREVFHVCQNRMLEADEINAFLVHIVVPQCMYHDDGSPKIPSNLLRLFLSWTSIPKLFYLLRLPIPSVTNTVSHSLLSILCSMLSSKSVSKLMKEKIIDGLLNLLTLADEVMPDPVADINLMEIPKISGLNSGTCMVLPELPKLLAFIFDSLSLQSENRKLNTKHLEVLNRISEFIQDEEIIRRYVSILLTFLELGIVRSDDAVQSSLQTILRMVAVATDATQFLKNLINMQSLLKERSHRETLQQIEEAIVMKLRKSDQRKAELLSYVVSLDAWDGRRIDEPDYDKRHDAYVNLHKALTADEVIEPVLLYLQLHNDYYVIVQVNDISLRSAATKNFRNVIEYFGKCNMNEREKQNGVDSHILPLVLKGLHDQKEVIRHDFANLLVSMIASFPTHRHLRHLESLRNTAEVDLDFFENITHMQIHRRQRAFYKLTQDLQSKKIGIPNGVLLRFVLPFLQPYVMNLSSSTSALSDAALALLTQIMRGAPWKKYFPMLDFYMKRLKKESVNVNHKAVIRIIVALVDAFHYNISEEEQEPVIKRKRTNDELEIETNDTPNDWVAGIEEVSIEVDTSDRLKRNTSSIHQKVVGYLIPRLKDCATGKDLVSHRKAQSGKYYKEDDDIQRAPIAFATVKLLKKMPQKVMDDNLPGVIIKICSLLMSRSTGIREAAGKTVIEIAKILGPKYLRFIIREMKQTMRKGYQLHVMIFYVHKLLSAMEEQLCAGDLDSCLMDIVDVCTMDLFGSAAEEKTVSGITKDVPEAKIQRTYETYRLLGRYISSQYLGSVLTVLKKVVESAPDIKTLQKVSRLLRQYSLGLSTNEGIEPEVALIFAHQLLNNQITEVLRETKSSIQQDAQQTKEGKRPESCLVLEKEPNRIGLIAKVSVKSRMHIFVEFGLCELYLVLKKKAFDVESKNDVARLDPFVDIILQCLQLKYDKILVHSLRCFLILLRFPLPSMRAIMSQFLNRLFILLADYTSSIAIDNTQEYARKSVEVSQLVFKAITQVIKDAPSLVLTSKRLQLLLTYVETDIVDNQKQAVAFPLIKAIITRKLQDPMIIGIIQYLSETAVISEVSHIREQCRQVIIVFVGNHPQCKKPSKYVEFFLEQLDYQHEDGRKSAVEMLNMFFEKLSMEINDQYALLAFVKLAARLMNDESTECRRMVVLAVQKLIVSISESKRNDLYLATRDWLESKKEVYICIAIQTLVIFNKLGGEKFGRTLRELLPTFSEIVCADILYLYSEESIVIIVDSLNLLMNEHKNQTAQFAEEGLLDSILREMGPLARCSKSPTVQLSSARFLGSLFSILNKEYMLSRSNPSAREFLQWTLAEMKTYQLTSELAEQVAKNLVYLFDLVLHSDENLRWLCHRLSVLCNFELVKFPSESVRRISIFKVIAVIILKVDANRVDVVVQSLLPSLYREMQGKSTQISLCQMYKLLSSVLGTEILQKIAIEVAETIRGRIGDEEFTKRIAECHKLLASRLEGRKRKQKEEAVLDPTSSARKKIRKNKMKRRIRKRRTE
uniref:DRIM domain-containing protein n=1 Tax=Elaeophora elaphi TaxID=1147741 RepID=A0A0R3RU82_9BILA